MDDHLTVLDRKFESQRRATYPGMAHWAGTGPRGKRCADCRFFEQNRPQDNIFDSPEGRCAKYVSLMRASQSRVPVLLIAPITAACKYFAEAEKK